MPALITAVLSRALLITTALDNVVVDVVVFALGVGGDNGDDNGKPDHPDTPMAEEESSSSSVYFIVLFFAA